MDCLRRINSDEEQKHMENSMNDKPKRSSLHRLCGSASVVTAFLGLVGICVMADGNASGSYSCSKSCADGSTCSTSGTITSGANSCCVTCLDSGGCTATGYDTASYPYTFTNGNGQQCTLASPCASAECDD